MQNDLNKPNRIKYLLPWIGMAAVIGLNGPHSPR